MDLLKINFTTIKSFFCKKCNRKTLHDTNPKYDIRVCTSCEEVTSRYPYRKIVREYYVDLGGYDDDNPRNT
jgi:RNase P subunit RPR2